MSEKKEKLSEVLNKVISVGVGAAFMTEESVKSILGDLPLPKDIVNGLLKNANNAKAEFIEGVQNEVKQRLSKVDPYKLLEELIANHDIEVNAKIKLTPKKKNKNSKKNN